MQESLVVDLTKFSSITRSMLVRDIKTGAVMRPRLGFWMKQHPHAVNEALRSTWPATGRSYTEWKSASISNDTCWVTATVRESDGNPQVVHLHLLHGSPALGWPDNRKIAPRLAREDKLDEAEKAKTDNLCWLRGNDESDLDIRV
jgi:hypothetical protein